MRHNLQRPSADERGIAADALSQNAKRGDAAQAKKMDGIIADIRALATNVEKDAKDAGQKIKDWWNALAKW